MIQHGNQLWKPYAKWDKPDTKGQILYWFHLHEVLRGNKFIETESRIKVTRGWGEEGMEREWVQSFCCGNEKVLEIAVMVV